MLNKLYHNCRYNRLPEDETLGSKYVRGGGDKSLARPTSRCRRTEYGVLLPLMRTSRMPVVD